MIKFSHDVQKKFPAQSTVLLHSTTINMCSSQLNSHWLNFWVFRSLGDIIRRRREPSNFLKEDFPVKPCFDLWYIYVHLSVWAHVHVYVHVRATHAHTHTHIRTHNIIYTRTLVSGMHAHLWSVIAKWSLCYIIQS